MDRGNIVAVDRPENISARLEGGARYEIEVAGPVKKILAKLREVKGVVDVTVTGSGDTRLYMVESKPGRDIRDELSSAVVESGYRLLGLKAHEMSLEDIFLKLTTTEKE